MKEYEKKLFNLFSREIISNKQHTDDNILDNINDKEIRYTKEFRQIPVYQISPYEWLDKVSFNADKIDNDTVTLTGCTQCTRQSDIERVYNEWVNKITRSKETSDENL